MLLEQLTYIFHTSVYSNLYLSNIFTKCKSDTYWSSITRIWSIKQEGQIFLDFFTNRYMWMIRNNYIWTVSEKKIDISWDIIDAHFRQLKDERVRYQNIQNVNFLVSVLYFLEICFSTLFMLFQKQFIKLSLTENKENQTEIKTITHICDKGRALVVW